MSNETDNNETNKKEKKNKKPSFFYALIVSICLLLVMFAAIVWIAAKKPLIIKQLIETNITTVVKEILPASEYVCLIYNYQSIMQRSYNPGSWLNARNLLIVLDGTIKLGFNCNDIEVKERGSQLIINMPPVKILAHEQYPERARSYELAGGGILPRSITPQEVLNLLGDSKLEKDKQVQENTDLLEQARAAAESLFKPLLEFNPSIRGNYDIIFNW